MNERNRWVHQAAAVALLSGQICLVRTSGGGRWVIPKGHVEKGQTAQETALQEAWEEAGIVGVLGSLLGHYRYKKRGKTCRVEVFLLHVTHVAPKWPERQKRRRAWTAPEEVFDYVEERGLRRLLMAHLRENGANDLRA